MLKLDNDQLNIKPTTTQQQQSLFPSNIKTNITTTPSVAPINFTNSNLNTEYAPIQKTAQELKM
jgi:hypothetical protein